jgi:hypothetical protein
MASANGELTVSAWVNLASLPTVSGASIISKGQGDAVNGEFEYELVFETDGEVDFVFYNNRGGNIARAFGFPPAGFSLGTWHLITGTLKRDQFIRVYVDGALVSENTVFNYDITVPPANTNAPVNIGSRGPIRFLHGSIDEAQLYQRALFTSEIQAIFNAGMAGNCKPTAVIPPSGLVSWWPGDTDAKDIEDGNSPVGVIGSPTLVPA